MPQYQPVNPGNVLILPQLTPPIGPMQPLDAQPMTAVEYPSDTSSCTDCECVMLDSTGWGFAWRTGPCDPTAELLTGTDCSLVDDFGHHWCNLEQVCQKEANAGFEYVGGDQFSGIPIPEPSPFRLPFWLTGEGFTPFQEVGWTMACGDNPLTVQLEEVCTAPAILDPVTGLCNLPTGGGGGCAVPPPCPKGFAIGADGCCKPFLDPPLPLASDGNGFASPSGPYALPVHPILSANSLLSCGACSVGPGQGEELELANS